MVEGLGLGLLSLDDLGAVRWMVGPGTGLWNRPAGQWKGTEDPGWAGQGQGSLSSGKPQPLSLLPGGLQPGPGGCHFPVSQSCPSLPASWVAVTPEVDSAVLNSLAFLPTGRV